MERALALARRGVGAVSPNPPVGAVAVRGGEIIGEGFHERFGGPHAEAKLIASSSPAALRGAHVYVTLEPCGHQGKTPPCCDALIAAGISDLTYSVSDPNPETAGRGPQRLRAAGIRVTNGLLEREGRRLIAPYLCWHGGSRPLVTAKWAMSIDGHIATRTGDARWISSDQCRARTRSERALYDAILVGSGTVRRDDPELLPVDGGARPPLRVALAREFAIPGDSRLVRALARAPLLVVGYSESAIRNPDAEAKRARLEALGARTLSLQAGDGGVELQALLAELAAQDVQHLLVEGGARLHGAFLDAGLVDRVQVIVAPRLIGGGTAPAPVAGRGVARVDHGALLDVTRVDRVGRDLLIEGDVSAVGRGR